MSNELFIEYFILDKYYSFNSIVIVVGYAGFELLISFMIKKELTTKMFHRVN